MGVSYFVGQRRAVDRVHHAVRKGRLPHIGTQRCVDCGAPAAHYEHRDYNKPLQVDPVCAACNGVRGHAIPLGCPTYVAGFAGGYVVTRDGVRATTFEVVDFGDYEEA